MPPNPVPPYPISSLPNKLMSRVLGSLSIFTMLMTIPQVLTIWLSHQAAGVSIPSWSAYLLSALFWFWHGVQKRDPNIYLACIGWMILDGGVIVGVLLNR
jgi:uncharacterized protein with PQ loop repeat